MKDHGLPTTGMTVMLALAACGKSSSPVVIALADAEGAASAGTAAASAAPASPGNDGTDPKAPVLSPEDATFTDSRKGLGWSDRCFTEIRAGKLGWAKAACDRALALPEVDAKARPALLYNEGMIAKKSSDDAAARSYFSQSLALRTPEDPGRAEVEKELVSVGGTRPAPSAQVVGTLECRARDGAKTFEVFIDHDFHGGNEGIGSIRISSDGGPVVQAVDVRSARGSIEIYAAHSSIRKPMALLSCAGQEMTGDPFGSGCGPASKKQLVFADTSARGWKPPLACE